MAPCTGRPQARRAVWKHREGWGETRRGRQSDALPGRSPRASSPLSPARSQARPTVSRAAMPTPHGASRAPVSPRTSGHGGASEERPSEAQEGLDRLEPSHRPSAASWAAHSERKAGPGLST